VQESLTNVLRHARAGRAEVRITRTDGAVVVDVQDDGTAGAPRRAGSPGTGIAGMRARAEALGGTLEAGPLPSGGFAVHARLPDPSGVSGSEP
jgi:signal transduction histidine kinase